MADQISRGRHGSRYQHSYSKRHSRSPHRDNMYRPPPERHRSPTAPRGRSSDRRGASYFREQDRHGGRSRERHQTVNRLPSDHPLIREIGELRRVRWNRLQDWIRLAQRLGKDWDHPNSPDFWEFHDEEKAATTQLEKLAGAIALAERNLPFDREPEHRRGRSAPRRPAPAARKRKHENETQIWTEKNSEPKVAAWMKSTKAKQLENEKPEVPLFIGSSDTDEDLFLPDEPTDTQERASHDHVDNQDGSTQTVRILRANELTKPAKPTEHDAFSSTRERADEFLQDLASNVPMKANAKLPPPPIVPILDVPEQSLGQVTAEPSGKATNKPMHSLPKDTRPVLQETRVSTSNKEATSNVFRDSTNEEFDLAAYLRWLNSGKAIPEAIRKPTQQLSTAMTVGPRVVTEETPSKEIAQPVKQEPVDIKDLLRALAPHGGS